MSDSVRILLVDDQPANLFALEQVLVAPGYQLVRAESGEQALAFLLRSECAVILLDVAMPGMDGYEVARLVRQSPRTRDIPIVFVTAMANDERDVLDGYESGAIDYLVKPVRPEVLRSKVAGFVALYRARQEIRRQAELLREHERLQHRSTVAELELRALQRQQVAQRRYQTLVEGLSRAFAWVVDPVTFVPRVVSPGAAGLLGLERDWWAAGPRAWLDRVHPEDLGRFVDALGALAPGGAETRLEHRMIGGGGCTLWFETSVRLIVGDEPSATELHGLSTDVTAAVMVREEAAFLARASADLAASLDFGSTLRTSARVAIPELAEWCVVEAGAPQGLAVAHEAARQETATTDAAALLDVERLRAVHAPALAAPASLFRDAAARALEALAPCAAVVVPLSARAERIGTLCLFSRDRARLDPGRLATIAELGRRIAQALENASLHERTLAAVLAREQFLSIASHELRTPLSALSLQSTLISRVAERVREPAEVREDLARRIASVQRQVVRLGALTNSVLDLARIRSARLRLEPDSCDLCEIARDVAAQFDDALREQRRVLTLALHDPLVGRWDRTRIEQLLSNLVGNAVKHAGAGSITVTVERSGDSAIATVADTGPGIPEAEQGAIFEAFAQGKRAAVGGLGLGLYIARSIAVAHGGTISLSSAPERGTSFRVELPLGERGAAASRPHASSGSVGAPAP
jgi:signal transduction histidine kinase/CheY-like chemotaxis protein